MLNPPSSLRFPGYQSLSIVLSLAALLVIGCGHSHAQIKEIPMSTVMDAIHNYSKGYVAPTASYKPLEFAPTDHFEAPEDVFAPFLKSQIMQDKFDDLEYIASQARLKKSMHSGGVWVLYDFYSAVGTPLMPNPSPAQWDEHIDHLKKWVADYPESSTARISLASGYAERAWASRGNGYADTVSDDGWNDFTRYNNLAKATLLEAATLKEKDPHWYYFMLQLALAEGWTKSQARDLFDQAIAFEPGYYHFYREYAQYLLPRWHGEEGDPETLAEELPKRLKEPTASMMYFETVTTYLCACFGEPPTLDGASWPLLKEGYNNITKLYGASSLKLNRYAYLAYVAKDKSAAHEAFTEIGDAYNRAAWRSQSQYETARAWATAP